MIASGAYIQGKEGHHGVKSKGIGEEVFITGEEICSWDSRRIEAAAPSSTILIISRVLSQEDFLIIFDIYVVTCDRL